MRFTISCSRLMQYVPRCLNIALDFDICSRDLQFNEDPIMILK